MQAYGAGEHAGGRSGQLDGTAGGLHNSVNQYSDVQIILIALALPGDADWALKEARIVMRARWIFLWFLVVIFGGPRAAKGAGLLEPASEAAGAAVSSPLLRIVITAELDDAQARITEVRSYGAATGSSEARRFYRALPEGGTVESATLDGNPLSGSVLPAAEADALRRELVLALHNPAPLRELGQPMFVSEPISSGGPAELAVTTRLPLAPHGTLRGAGVPLDWHERDIPSVEVEVSAQSESELRALYAPYHELALTREGEHRAIGTHRGTQVCSRFDVLLLTSAGDEPVRLDLLPFRYGPDDSGHVMALLSAGAIPTGTSTLGRDLVLALDVSGSMAGEKLVQAKQALSGVVTGLREEDRIALVTFNGSVTAFGDSAAPATPDAREGAIGFVEALAADGGTNIAAAIERSFSLLPPASGRPRYVILLTDGQPTEGITDVNAIVELAARLNEGRARLFSFGIGDDVNTNLLGRLASDSAGDALYVRPGQSVASAVEGFFSKISDPVLANPELESSDLHLVDRYPASLPDLFAGQTLAVLARYPAPGSGVVTLRGTRGSENVAYSFDVSLPEYAFENGFVPRVWALRHVGALLERIQLGGADPALVEQVLAVARRYGIVTNFTFYRADESDDLSMVYSPVPEAVVGSIAVDTATSIDGYTQGGTAETSVDTEVRYFQDRNFPRLGGYPSDSTLPSDAAFVELHFGSDRYFELAASEALYSAPGFLAVAPELTFELLGRAFRVSDPEAREELPAEAEAIPAPTWLPSDETPLGVTPHPASTTPDPEEPSGADPLPGTDAPATAPDPNGKPGLLPGGAPESSTDPGDVGPRAEPVAPSPAGVGCTLSPGASPGAAVWLLALAAIGAFARRRRRTGLGRSVAPGA